MKSQSSNKCYLCKKLIKTDILLCSSCKNDPYLVEDARNMAASKKNLKYFKMFYESDYAEVINNNTERFWDNEFENELTLKNQDNMTKDKINTLAGFIHENNNILDLGFGQGYLEERIISTTKNIQFTGVDISKKAVIRASKKFPGKYVLGDVINIKSIIKNQKYDVIVAVEVIEHIPPSKILNFLSDINSLLKKGGTIIISTPLNEHLRNSKLNPSSHVRDYTIPIIKTEFEISGFKQIDYRIFYAFSKYYLIKKTLAKIMPNHWEPNNVIVTAIKK